MLSRAVAPVDENQTRPFEPGGLNSGRSGVCAARCGRTAPTVSAAAHSVSTFGTRARTNQRDSVQIQDLGGDTEAHGWVDNCAPPPIASLTQPHRSPSSSSRAQAIRFPGPSSTSLISRISWACQSQQQIPTAVLIATPSIRARGIAPSSSPHSPVKSSHLPSQAST